MALKNLKDQLQLQKIQKKPSFKLLQSHNKIKTKFMQIYKENK